MLSIQNVLAFFCWCFCAALFGIGVYQASEPSPAGLPEPTYVAAVALSIAAGVLGLLVGAASIFAQRAGRLRLAVQLALALLTVVAMTAVGLWADLTSKQHGKCSGEPGKICPEVQKLVDVQLGVSIANAVCSLVLSFILLLDLDNRQHYVQV